MSFGPRSQVPNKLGSIQVQSSEVGVVIPWGAGSFKAPVKLLDYVDFTATKQYPGGKGGGNYSYDYTAAVDMLFCSGPVGGVGNVYSSSGGGSLIGATETHTIPSGLTITVANNGLAFYYDEGVTYSQPFSVTANDYGSDGETTTSGIQQALMAKVGTPSPGPLQYFVALDGGNAGIYSFNAADAGKAITITYAYTTEDTNTGDSSSNIYNRSPLEQYAVGFIAGLDPQQPWGYMESRYPTRALSYPGLARLTAEKLDLGQSATPPNLAAEVTNGNLIAFGGGVADCDPAAAIAKICSDPVFGFDWNYLGDLTQYSNFCVANGLFLSPFYDSQRKATAILGELCDLTISEAVWSGAALKIVPYGDTTAVGNGRTFTPQTEPIYSLDRSDMIAPKKGEPVKMSWPDLTNNYNSVLFQYTRRDDNYDNDILNDKDEASILMNGLLPSKTITGDFYREKNYAAVAMNMLLKRNSYPLRTYKFTLKWWYCLLEPMDIVLLQTGIGDDTFQAVRIISVSENETFQLEIEAEDFAFGVASGVLYPKGDGNGATTGKLDYPGPTTLLAAFLPTLRLTNGLTQLWIAATGGASWGGCKAWLSIDGTNYGSTPVAQQNGSSRAGMLTAPLAAGSDPDTTDTASINISGSITGGSQADADSFTTLSLVGSELISYETATLVGSSYGTNAYDLTYLRRGVFTGNNQAHSAGEIFVRLDDSIIKYTIDPSLIGKPLFLKLTSFNLYGLQDEDLSNVQAYEIGLSGAASSSNMTVGSFLNSDGSATVDVYRMGTSEGTSGSGTLVNGAAVVLPATNWASEQAGQWYGVNYNVTAAAYVLYTDPNAWRAGQAAGYLTIGSTTTPTSSSGGSPGGSNYAGQYSDLGSSPTSTPAGAFQSSGAGVSSSATSNDGEGSQSNGLCDWFGWAGTTSQVLSLTFTASVSIADTNNASSVVTVTATLDGSTYRQLFSATESSTVSTCTLSIPSGTNLANVQVSAGAYSTATTSSPGSSGYYSGGQQSSASSSAYLTIANLQIS